MLSWIWSWVGGTKKTSAPKLQGGASNQPSQGNAQIHVLDTVNPAVLEGMVPGAVEARVVEVHDADTITIVFVYAFVHLFKEKVRLNGINAWEVHPKKKRANGELRTEEDRNRERAKGEAARDWLRDQILNKHVWVVPVADPKTKLKREKFGRLLAEVYPLVGRGPGAPSYNHQLLALGHAHPYDGRRKREFEDSSEDA